MSIADRKILIEVNSTIEKVLDDFLSSFETEDNEVTDLIEYLYTERLFENREETKNLFDFFKKQQNDFGRLVEENEGGE